MKYLQKSFSVSVAPQGNHPKKADLDEVFMYDNNWLLEENCELRNILIEVDKWFRENSPGDNWEYPEFLNKLDVYLPE